MADGENLRQVSDRIERLLEEVRSMASRPAVARVDELVRLIVHLYGKGLEKILEIVDQADAGGSVIARLSEDPLIASILVLHGLHPVSAEDRIQGALEKVRPYLGSHAGGVEFLGLDESGVVRLRLEGSCHGCPSSTVTVKMAIERAIEEAAPEVTRIEVQGVAEKKSAGPRPPPLEASLGNGVGHGGAGPGKWAVVEEVRGLTPGTMTSLHIEGAQILVCSVAGNLYAYRNACASCGSALDKGGFEGELLTCPSCRERFDVRLAGRSVEQQKLHLDPLPLLSDASGTRIAVPEA
jgi:Fe-S cluster biogenesis protein NfuA/nitrite reductase/ring-hydroxylating ferredoxin subunit